MMVMAEFAATQAGEVGFRAVGAGAVDAVTVLVVDPPHREAGVQRVPGEAPIGMNRGALGNPPTDSRRRRQPRPGTPAPACGRRARAWRRQPGACPTGFRPAAGRPGRRLGSLAGHGRRSRRRRSRLCIRPRRSGALSWLDAMASRSLCASTKMGGRPRGIRCATERVVTNTERGPPTMSISMIGLDTAKSVFQVHAWIAPERQ